MWQFCQETRIKYTHFKIIFLDSGKIKKIYFFFLFLVSVYPLLQLFHMKTHNPLVHKKTCIFIWIPRLPTWLNSEYLLFWGLPKYLSKRQDYHREFFSRVVYYNVTRVSTFYLVYLYSYELSTGLVVNDLDLRWRFGQTHRSSFLSGWLIIFVKEVEILLLNPTPPWFWWCSSYDVFRLFL